MPFLGSIVFECIGALVRWLYFQARNGFTDDGRKSFREIWKGKKGSDSKEAIENAWLNIGIGMTLVVITCSILIWLGI